MRVLNFEIVLIHFLRDVFGTVGSNCLSSLYGQMIDTIIYFVLAVPPYVPNLDGAADVSHFDEFEPESPDPIFHLEKYRSAHEDKGFTGKDLPFVGFTFSRNLAINLPFSPRK